MVEEAAFGENTSKLDWLYKLDRIGIETRGIERVPPEERQAADSQSNARLKQFLHVIGLWFAGCGGLTSMSSFFLPSLVFGLNLRDAMISGLISLVIGCLVPAYCATLGPKSGCRQMVNCRFIFGQWGIRIIGLFCGIGYGGWSVVNCVLGGQLISTISNIGLDVGIIIISISALIISIFGIKIVLKSLTALAVPGTIANILFYVVVLHKKQFIHQSNKLIASQNVSSLNHTGNWLSFFNIGFSVTATWGGGASDYYILFPEDTPSHQVFLVTLLGISIPTIFASLPGMFCGAIALGYPPWNEIYNAQGVGGLITAAFEPWGSFGKFVVVLLYLSLICNNIINNYCVAFDFQTLDLRLAKVPRWMFAIVMTVIVLTLSLVGKNNFSTILSNLLPMLGYWISIFIAIVLEETLIFRSKKFRQLYRNEVDDYDLESKTNSSIYMFNWNNWNQLKKITHGIAAICSMCIGAVGAIVGMNQVYWRGPIARKIGSDGGDVGSFLCFGFTALVYPILRMWELKVFGK